MLKNSLFLFIVCVAALGATSTKLPHIQKIEQISSLFPKSQEEVIRFQKEAIDYGEKLFKQVELSDEKESYQTVIKPIDEAFGYLQYANGILETLFLVSPDPSIRESAQAATVVLSQYMEEIYASRENLYAKVYQLPRKKLTPSQQAYVQKLLLRFKMSGQGLSAEKRAKVVRLQQEIATLSLRFDDNIQKDSRTVPVLPGDLAGMSPHFISSLPQTPDGKYLLSCDYPCLVAVLSGCSNNNVRKELQTAFNNIAYPANEEVLKELIQKRDMLAKELGYRSYAEFSLYPQMAKDPKKVEEFLQKVWALSSLKEEKEFALMTDCLPESVALSDSLRLYPWDGSFVYEQYRKKHYDLNQEEIAEYFPMESTFKGLMGIYEQFFGIAIQEVPVSNLWHEEIRLMEVKDGKEVLGYILLDLFPRENKYHHACQVAVLPGILHKEKSTPALSVVIANFNRASDQRPSLLKYGEVRTFFHEFGHALHEVFAQNEIIHFAGNQNVCIDFVEMPSQILEEWLADPDILKNLSSHYITKEPLPREKIEKIVESKNLLSGTQAQKQCFYSFLALYYFAEGEDKDPLVIMKDLEMRLCPHYEVVADGRRCFAFSHLSVYGPSYYGYLWSKVFALDVFEQVKKEGLLNENAGRRYRKEILAPGSEKDPYEMLKSYLGREPSQEAFLQNLGV